MRIREDGIVCVDSYMRNLFTIGHSELRYFLIVQLSMM